jgi:hypothetical protein
VAKRSASEAQRSQPFAGLHGTGEIGTRACTEAQRRFALPHRPGTDSGADLEGEENALTRYTIGG